MIPNDDLRVLEETAARVAGCNVSLDVRFGTETVPTGICEKSTDGIDIKIGVPADADYPMILIRNDLKLRFDNPLALVAFVTLHETAHSVAFIKSERPMDLMALALATDYLPAPRFSPITWVDLLQRPQADAQ